MTNSPTPPETSAEERAALIAQMRQAALVCDLRARSERTLGQFDAEALNRAADIFEADAARLAAHSADFARMSAAMRQAAETIKQLTADAEMDSRIIAEWEGTLNDERAAAETRIAELSAEVERLEEALDWYAGPITHAAIAEGEQP